MKKVELFTIVSGPKGTHHPGEIVLLDDVEAAQLVAAHCARYVGRDGKPEEAKAPPRENAAGGRKRKRRRRGHDNQPQD